MNAVKYVASFRWANTLSEVAGWLSGAALILATGVTVHAVLVRYLFAQPTIWQTEFSIYLLMFVAFVGATYGLKHNAHVGVDLLVDSLPVRARLILRIATSIFALVVVCAVLYSASHEWQAAYEGGWESATAWRAPLGVVYGILPIGMLLVALQLLAFLIEGVQFLMGRLEPGRQPALLGQGNSELAAAITPVGDTVHDEGRAPEAFEAQQARADHGRRK